MLLRSTNNVVAWLRPSAVVAKIEDAIKRIAACGKPAGILTGDEAFAQRCIGLGTTFTAVGVDVGLLAKATTQLRQRFGAKG